MWLVSRKVLWEVDGNTGCTRDLLGGMIVKDKERGSWRRQVMLKGQGNEEPQIGGLSGYSSRKALARSMQSLRAKVGGIWLWCHCCVQSLPWSSLGEVLLGISVNIDLKIEQPHHLCPVQQFFLDGELRGARPGQPLGLRPVIPPVWVSVCHPWREEHNTCSMERVQDLT